MNWEVVGAIAETIGAIAVIATLIFLSVQVRAQATATRGQILQERSNRLQDAMIAVAESPDLGRIQSEILTYSDDGTPKMNRNAISALSPEDFERYRSFLVGNYFRLDNLIAQYELGLIDDETVHRAIGAVENSVPLWRAFKMPPPTELLSKIKRIKGGA